ncbi:MAG TPA: TetR family transcriptional regulator [Pseudonocardiaceae bacterium]|jgi:AcrR family transcriptional regulator|nr:TetR family transcriptional regulator [Pseudonocardiaceae bacterium]
MRNDAPEADLFRHAVVASLPSGDTAELIMDAALEQAEDFGLRRFTMEDVARRTRLSRVTVHRHFPKRSQLLETVMLRELGRFLTKVDEAIEQAGTPEARLTEGMVFCLTYLRGHRLLNRLIRTEPDLILPYLTTDADRIIDTARAWIAGHIRAEIAAGTITLPRKDAEYIAELLTRLVISLVITPNTALPLDSPEARKRFSQHYLAPMVRLIQPRPVTVRPLRSR